ncbi:helix-turn-helix domain-containing protein [Spirillospora sp. NPDC047279]|uniref:PucR family transcriptional regulator n=1 Tax=Spirillospora sp. NPDC047279 TaxID=3155478 RepID=UPI0033E4821F
MGARDREIIVDPLLSRCATALIDRVSELADEMFRAITTEDDLYAHMGPERRADVRDFNERNLREQLTCMAEGRPVSTEMSRVNARRRAAQGVPLAALLHAFRIGYRVMWQALLTEARTWPDASAGEIAQATMTVWALFDACSETVNEVYRETLLEMARVDERRRFVLLEALFEGRVADWSMLGGTAEALGLPGRGPYVSVVAGRDESGAVERALARAGLRSAWRPRTDDLAGIVAVPGATDAERAYVTIDEAVDGRAGASPTYEALSDTAAALRLATIARDSLPHDARGAATLDRDPISSLAAAAGPELTSRLVTSVLGAVLAHHDHKALIEALSAWLETGSTSEVATRLYCHRNTVRNRLDRIEQLTGRSLTVPTDTATLYAAVRAYRLPKKA